MKRFGSEIKKKEPMTYALVLFLFSLIIGCVFAKITQNLLAGGIESLNSRYFSTIKQMDIQYTSLLKYILTSLLKEFFIVWILSLTILGIPYLAWLIISHAFQFGYLLTVLCLQYGFKGFVLVLAYWFPQAFIYIPVAILCLKGCFELTMEVNHQGAAPSLHNFVLLKHYYKLILILLAALIAGALLETYVGSYIVRKAMTMF